jgi:hypothetical protein
MAFTRCGNWSGLVGREDGFPFKEFDHVEGELPIYVFDGSGVV